MVSLKSLQNKPIADGDGFSIEWGWCWVVALYLFAAGTLGASFLRFEGNERIAARLFLRLAGIGAIATGLAKTREVQYWAKYAGYREVIREDTFIAQLVQPEKSGDRSIVKPAPEETGDDDEVQIYDWERLESEATGIAIFGNPGYGKSSVALWLLGWLTRRQPAKIEICHPHAGIDRGFEEHGFSPVSEYDEIEQCFADALEEFTARKRRAKNREPIGAPYFLVADETDSYARNFKNPDLFQEVQTVLGKEGRKYNMTLIFISHTSNVTNKKIDAQERDCFTSINLGNAAISRAEKIWGKKSAECKLLKQQAYPCMLIASGIPYLALHPTHGEYSSFQKEGNPPKNLLPINKTGGAPAPHHAPDLHQTRTTLETLYRQECTNAPLEEQFLVQCPECGSENIRTMGKRNNKTRYRCKDCGKAWS